MEYIELSIIYNKNFTQRRKETAKHAHDFLSDLCVPTLASLRETKKITK